VFDEKLRQRTEFAVPQGDDRDRVSGTGHFHRQRREREGLRGSLSDKPGRLRPILMTSFAFISALPLVRAPGAELRKTLGTAVFCLIFTPVFYVTYRRLALRMCGRAPAGATPPPAPAE
jgi:hypothetical protein